MNSKNLSYYSEKYLSHFTNTRSLTKIEELIKDDKDLRLAYVAAGYVYYNKADRIKPSVQPTLYEHLIKFSKEKDSDFKKNEYRKVNDMILNYANEKESNQKQKEDLKTYLKKRLEENEWSILELSKKTNIKYSNLYNFIKKGELKQLSSEKLDIILEVINE